MYSNIMLIQRSNLLAVESSFYTANTKAQQWTQLLANYIHLSSSQPRIYFKTTVPFIS
jgi:hypothetical protein